MHSIRVAIPLILLAASAMSYSARAATLAGTVVDENGGPIPEARVWVTQKRRVRTFTSDAGGQFTVDGIDVAMTEIVGYKQGYALGGATALIVGDTTVSVRLLPGDLITVKMMDVQSRPIPGAIVRSMLVRRDFLVSVEDLVPHGLPPMRSDDQGILVIAPLPKDSYIQPVFGHPKYADSSVSYLPVEPERQNILLREGKRVGGRVTHAGAGVAGARVSVFKAGGQGQKEFAEVLTDGEGFFHARVEAGHYGVAAQHEDYASPSPVPVEVPAGGEPAPVNLVLESPHDISGRVLYPDKKPCGGARILYRRENIVFQDTFTNNDGAFSLRVPGGPGYIKVVPPRGYQTPYARDIKVDLGDVRQVEMKPVRLKALPVIQGTFRDKDGQQPGPVLVSVHNLPVRYSTATDEEGHLTLPLDFMPDVKELRLTAEHAKRFQRAEFLLDLKQPDAFDVRLKSFKPDLATREPFPGINNLSGLVGKPAEKLRGTEWVNSDPVHLADLKGKVVVLLFWIGFDDDMGPVVLRELVTLHHLLADVEDVAFLGIHDATSTADEIREYIEHFSIPFPVLRDEDQQTTFSKYNIVRLPQIVLLDKQGNVRYYQTEGRLLSCIKGLRRE